LWERDVPNFRGMNILTPTVWGDSILTSSYRNLTHLFTVRLDEASRPIIEETWTYKSPGYMSSPIVIGDHAFLHLGNGRLTCLDLRSGESRWTTTPLGDYWSLAFQGDRILALNEAGELLLLRANPERPEILARLEISGQPTWGHLAVDGGQLFVRELEGLRVLDLGAPPAEVPSG
jgi:outer membrane protein assembly factor BamB